MIPKTIHYCWFGRGPKPKLAQKCIASWKKYLPDYEIIEWNEDNFDIDANPYTRMCYDQKKFAFLTDYVRLIVVEEHGGIYFDTDVEVIRSFDDLLSLHAFFGFENNDYVNTGEGFGARAHHPVVQQMIAEYAPLLDGEHGVIGCPILNTRAVARMGFEISGNLQTSDDATIFPADRFNPRNSITGTLAVTDNSYSIHWYAASWMPWYKRLRSKIAKPIHRLFHNQK